MRFSEIENAENQAESRTEINQELMVLMKETSDLNKLMQSYIRVHLNEDTMKKVTMESELESMKETSREIQGEMVSILEKLENTQKTYAGKLHQLMENGKTEIQANNQKTLTRMSEIEKTLKVSLDEMNGSMEKSLSELEQRTSTLIGDARKGLLINYWADVVKYGLGTALFVVPVYMLTRFVLGLLGIESI